MQMKFCALLAGVLVALSAEALPHPKPQPGTVTLPLTRLEHRSNAHPQIVSGVFLISCPTTNILVSTGPSTTYQPQPSSPRAYDWS
jgi:hypothetical protein